MEGKDLSKWHHVPKNAHIIFTRRGIDINNYPSILEHLSLYREQLEPKPKNWQPAGQDGKWAGRKEGSYKWYEIQDSIDFHLSFSKKKLIYMEMSSKPSFSIDVSGRFHLDTVHHIPNPDFFLLALLNSCLYWFLCQCMCGFIRGRTLRLKTQWMQNLPITKVSDPLKSEIANIAEACQLAAEERYALQDAFRRRIPDLAEDDGSIKLTNKLKNWWELDDFAAFRKEAKKALKTDIPLRERGEWEAYFTEEQTRVQALSTRIASLEADLNAKVYALFDLTPDEIALIEQELEGKI